ncbi:hypothetical protein ACHAQA_002840 [Verticillium albo-atrum]
MFLRQLAATFLLGALVAPSAATLRTAESTTEIVLENDNFRVAVSKRTGGVTQVVLDGENLLGTGRGPYVDCQCTPAGFWVPGGSQLASFQLVEGVDSTGVAYGGVIMIDRFAATNQTLEQYYFLRETETGLHMFTRATYFNETTPALRTIGELRTLFRPNTPLWTHMYSGEGNSAPRSPSGATVQDATTYVGNLTAPYVDQYSDFFTKYSFSDQWRNHKAHGMYSDGTTTQGNQTYGAWLVHNTVETYYGGPLHSDIMVDNIVYNYIISSHHGARTPMLNNGFDRTYGPQYYHFNKDGSMEELLADASQYADPEWNAEFYDSIAQHVPNYVTTPKRTTFKAKISVPRGAKRPIAILAENGRDFQNNTLHPESLQYWGEISRSGEVEIPRVKAGTYRLTVYADGIFGQFEQDDVEVRIGGPKNRKVPTFRWKEESAGKEIWRIGTPDKSSGEFKHGNKPYSEKTLAPEEYRMYWAQWDFPTDFPDGVDFKVGESDPAEDFNYIHWSVISENGNFYRSEPYYENVNNWTIRFDLTAHQLARAKTATFTVQFAGVKTGTRTIVWFDLPYTLNVNGADVETWIIPGIFSSSCGVRSAVSCYNVVKKFTFPTSALKKGENAFVLSLPSDAASEETALLPKTTYLQYDALRLEFK